MRISTRYLILCSVVVLTGMRDPFHPPDDLCAAGQLAQWRYQGMVEGITTVGILQDGQKRWHRVRKDEHLPVGWRVISINEREMVVDVGVTCDPARWQWQREGTKTNENKDNALTDGAQRTNSNSKTNAGHARGG
ncbi:DUF2531 family protein [Enterobacter sp. RHBSTW-00994]|uniref:HofP DNA utilization family protein n=1 Tax=Enterobacter sp. RHBSTW-00994 TaxID=2742676 RepID=UPI0015E8FDC1|nr:HofP DNA utilization family protein [Enterobacter sp. RHBSTW-00994]QLR45044.1 DUF2531 family protein [Enterobacter sp. RHBSTW-00994]